MAPARTFGQIDTREANRAWTRALELTAPIPRNETITLPTVIAEIARKRGDAAALIAEGQYLTYAKLMQTATRYSLWAIKQNLSAGQVVCLLMDNCPEYFAIWLGIVRTGGVVALINSNLAGDALLHSIKIVTPRHVIVGSDHADALLPIMPRLGAEIRCWMHGSKTASLSSIDEEASETSDFDLPPDREGPKLKDSALYIYTSGTTGLPKAATVSHYRVMQWTHWFAGMLAVTSDDRMYNCLPMYHSTGGVVAVGAMLVGGGSVVIGKRFSASRFWDDLVHWDCTLFQYIGELCRYLLHSPPQSSETKHRLRLCCGNGLSAEVWEKFQRRFQIPRILEFYAATEGNISLYNCEGKPGAIGRIPAFLAHRFPIALISIDPGSGVPIRNADGFCIRCSADQAGEAIGKISDQNSNTGNRFEGYTDVESTERKILRHVFAKDDAWFRTGDLMRRDKSGYYYFVDRLGDTFRWKGENVSTTEIADAVSACSGVLVAVVYGVIVPGAEGRAGMAAIVVNHEFDLSRFRRELIERLPGYACPLFLRVVPEMNLTGTLKLKKDELMRTGYDPDATADAIFFNDFNAQVFVPMDGALYRQIKSGSIRL